MVIHVTPQRITPVPLTETSSSDGLLFVLATSPRSGSTLLASACWSTNRLGRPDEYLKPEDLDTWRSRWGLDASSDPGLNTYGRAMLHETSTSNNVCGLKLFPTHVLAAPASFLQPGASWLGARRTKVVHLRRHDKVGAAFSEWKATETNQWTRMPEDTNAVPKRPPRLGEITRYHELQHAWDRFWLGARAEGAPWMEIWFEDLINDVSGSVQRVGNFLGVEGDLSITKELPVQQSTEEERHWINQWEEATGGCDECRRS